MAGGRRAAILHQAPRRLIEVAVVGVASLVYLALVMEQALAVYGAR